MDILERFSRLEIKGRVLRFTFAISIIFTFLIMIWIGANFVDSQQLRQEMIDSRNRSYAVTNQTCGFTENKSYLSCSGEKQCFNLEDYENARCVRENFTRYYCGKHSNSIRLQSKPPQIDCSLKNSFKDRLNRWMGGGLIAARKPSAKLRLSYFDKNKSLKVSVTEGKFTVYVEDSGDIIFTSKNFTQNTREIKSRVHVEGYGRNTNDGIWAKNWYSFLGIELPGLSGLTSLPVLEGEHVTILGVNNSERLENGDQIFLYREETGVKDPKKYRMIGEIKIVNNSAKKKFWETDSEE